MLTKAELYDLADDFMLKLDDFVAAVRDRNDDAIHYRQDAASLLGDLLIKATQVSRDED